MTTYTLTITFEADDLAPADLDTILGDALAQVDEYTVVSSDLCAI